MKNRIIRAIIIIAIAAVYYTGCDSNTSINRSKTPASFSVEMTAVRDLTQDRDLAQLQFMRDSQPFSNAKITIGDDSLISTGNGYYSAQTPNLSFPSPTNVVTFSSVADSYLKTVSFQLPDNFSITSVNPRYNQGAYNVTVQWSHPNGTTGFVLAVISRDYPADNTTPLTLQLDPGTSLYVVLNTTFESSTGIIEPGTYYVYLVAYNGGFAPYPGMPFPLPSGLPSRSISQPAGHLRAGTIAPVDSIIVPL